MDVGKGCETQCGSKFSHIQTIVGLVLLFQIHHRPNRQKACMFSLSSIL